MPVPVPCLPKPCAHPVVKVNNYISTLIDSMPAPVLDSPPFLGPSEEWTTSFIWPGIQPWDQTPCRLSQDFSQGLTASGNAAVIKGAHAEACIPPVYDSLRGSKVVSNTLRNFLNDNKMGSDTVQVDVELHRRWTTDGQATSPPIPHDTVSLFTPILEDQSPGCASGPDGSSPLEPLTPFGDFVDRAVNAEQDFTQQDISEFITAEDYHVAQEVTHAALVFPTIADIPRQQDQPVTTPPFATSGYKTVVEPLARWFADYIWKACTTGYSLLTPDSQAVLNSHFAAETPDYLAPCIQNILLATLLQPSAVFLALWYIVRLPVFFGVSPGGESAKIVAFRAAFLELPYDHEVTENAAPLRLVVLGFMLANKWLDDHTFSNKTWHSISSIPIQTLNTLESRALDIFSYDLSISTEQWSQWLSHVMAHHASLTSPRPQPISRPSSNPHTIVRRAIEEIMQALVVPKSVEGVSSQPIFLGLERRLREKLESEAAMTVDVLEINLDEDGPLKEEYLPKRRANKPSLQNSRLRAVDPTSVAFLPPPAKWSPAGDEPIFRDRNRSNTYLPVQAPQLAPALPAYPLHGRPHDLVFNQNWVPAPYMPVKQMGYEIPTFFSQVQPAYNQFGQHTTVPLPHLRSQSLSYNQDNLSSRIHMRSYSQAGFGYGYNDFSMSMTDHSISIPETEARWMDTSFPYSGPVFVPIPAMGLQPAW